MKPHVIKVGFVGPRGPGVDLQGEPGQVLGFDADGNPVAVVLPEGTLPPGEPGQLVGYGPDGVPVAVDGGAGDPAPAYDDTQLLARVQAVEDTVADIPPAYDDTALTERVTALEAAPMPTLLTGLRVEDGVLYADMSDGTSYQVVLPTGAGDQPVDPQEPVPVIPTIAAIPDQTMTVGDDDLVIPLDVENAISIAVSPTGQGVTATLSELTIDRSQPRSGNYTVTVLSKTYSPASTSFVLLVEVDEREPAQLFGGSVTLVYWPLLVGGSVELVVDEPEPEEQEPVDA